MGMWHRAHVSGGAGTRRRLDRGLIGRLPEDHRRNRPATGAATAARRNRASRSSLSSNEMPSPNTKKNGGRGGLAPRGRESVGGSSQR